MEYTYYIETPPNTTEESPERLQIKLCVGILQKVSIYFPWGCGGAVGVRVLHYEHQLYPTNPDDWFTGNDIFIEFGSEYMILEGPNEFKVEAYNECDFFTHTPVVGFNVLRSGMYVPDATGWIGA